MLLSRTLRLVLESIGRTEEFEFYLRKFQSAESACFGILCPDAASLEQEGEPLLFDLEFLLRLELVPVVLLAGDDAERMRAWFANSGHAVKEVTQAADARAGFINLVVRPGEDAVEVLNDMMSRWSPRVHFLRVEGAFRRPDGSPVQTWYTYRDNADSLQEDNRAYVDAARALLETRPDAHISVSAPINLLRELFTVKGAGTVLRRGSRIEHGRDGASIDASRLFALFEQSFGKPLLDPDFFSGVAEFYIEESYRGAALLEAADAGLYLSKFAVETEARGLGLANELWEAVETDHPALFWRARDNNPIHRWYDRQSDGRHRAGGWNIYWRGMEAGALPALIDYCVNRPPDFRE